MDENQATTAAFSSAPSARELVACWEGNVRVFDLSSASVTMGRNSSCEIHLPHSSVSRTHARLSVGERGMEIEDLGSSNGVKVDGFIVSGKAVVLVGSMIEIGAIRLVVRVKGSASAAPMADVHRLVEKVAESPVSVILIGETGVGKEVLTGEIHTKSGRTGPLVSLNCAGLTATLLESELFGYERGAFTGAVQAKPGLIESAEGGTLFLDELGEMPESTQPKLLRVLESREVRRLGAVKGKPINVRFVSATHRDLQTLAAIGRFREDLLFRLNGFTIVVPPLRERRAEISSLAERFLREARLHLRKPVPRLSEGARVLLESYRWPGNVRELRNAMERIALLCEGDTVQVEHLIFDPARTVQVAKEIPVIHDDESEGAAMGDASSERDRIVHELAKAGGNQAAAAKALGITARVLAYRMDKLGLPRPRKK